MRDGLIIAGGRSTRFGATDKAVAELDGVPMIRRVAERLEPAVDRLSVNCRPDQIAAIRSALAGIETAIAYHPDEESDRGPLSGIATGLRGCEGELVFVTACDMPFLDPSIVSYLFEYIGASEAAVPTREGRRQPLHAVYRVGPMQQACAAALTAGEDRVVDAVDRLDVNGVEAEGLESVGSLRTFENLNTRSAFERAESRLAQREHQHR